MMEQLLPGAGKIFDDRSLRDRECGKMNCSGGISCFLRLTVIATLLGTSIACSGDAGGPGIQPGNDVASVEIAPPSLSLTVGTQQKLTAHVFDAAHVEMTGQTVTWSTDAPSVANVSQDGTVNAVGVGTARITAASGGKQTNATVTVTSTGGGGVTGTITLNPAVRFQTISGWEAHAQSGHETAAFQTYKNQLFDLAANDVGINRLRVEVRSGSENTVDYYQQWRSGQIDDATWRCVRYATVNDNSDAQSINTNGFKFSQLDSLVQNVVLPMQQRLQARGERLFINLEYTAFTNTICSPGQYHHDDSPQEYAEFILAATQHLRTRYGLTPDAWEVILEPDNTNFWRGPTIGAAIVATAARLSAAGITAKFITPSTARPNNASPYFDAMVSSVPAVVPHLLELSYHRYGTPTTADLQGIASRAAQHGINSSMLEHIGSGYLDLHDDLKLARVSAWQQFALAFGSTDDGSVYFTNNGTTVSVASRTRFLRQYFKFVRAGAVRIDATSANTALDPLAFINTNGNYVVVVKATAAASFTVGGLPAGQYGIKYTTNAAYDVNQPDVTLGAGQTLNTSIPAVGVITIYRK
jgi:hypothetical protein